MTKRKPEGSSAGADALGESKPSSAWKQRKEKIALWFWVVRRVFWSFRRTRPFWGAVWMMLAGIELIYWSVNPLIFLVQNGWSAGAGYALGGILIVFAIVALVAPMYANLMGLFGFLVALLAFPMSNLGGFILGSALGIIGGALMWSWGEKKPKAPKQAKIEGRRVAKNKKTGRTKMSKKKAGEAGA